MNKEMTPEERELYEKVVYWTKDEVDCYNEAIDRCISKVKQLDTFEPSEDYIFSKIVSELEQLKKEIK